MSIIHLGYLVEKRGHFVNMLIRPLRLGRFWLILYIKFFEVYLSQSNRETFCCNLFQVKCYISPAIRSTKDLFFLPLLLISLFFLLFTKKIKYGKWKKENTKEEWKEYKKSRKNAKRVISSAKEMKQNELNDSECQNEIFRMAKHMVKER